jgi:hypothetical protein
MFAELAPRLLRPRGGVHVLPRGQYGEAPTRSIPCPTPGSARRVATKVARLKAGECSRGKDPGAIRGYLRENADYSRPGRLAFRFCGGISAFRDLRACRTACISTATFRRTGYLPALRRAPCDTTHGRTARIHSSALRRLFRGASTQGSVVGPL